MKKPTNILILLGLGTAMLAVQNFSAARTVDPFGIIQIPHQNNQAQTHSNTSTVRDSAPAKGKVRLTLGGKTHTYKLLQLEPKDAAHVFQLMASQPAQTTQHPLNENPIFQDAEIVREPDGSPMYPKTSLVIGKQKILTTSAEDGTYEMRSLSSLETQPEILLMDTDAGGNGCASQAQVLLIRGEKGFQVTEAFGRCQISIFDDRERNTAYFVYPATESEPMEVLALTHKRR